MSLKGKGGIVDQSMRNRTAGKLAFVSAVNFSLEAGWRKCSFRSIVPSSSGGGSKVTRGNKMRRRDSPLRERRLNVMLLNS